MKYQISMLSTIFFVVCLFSAAVSAQVAAGGVYALNQAVVAGGGGTSAGGNYTISGTAGQPTAGNFSYGGSYAEQPGFWNAALLGPTAAGAIISGQVIKGENTGINNVIVTLTGGTLTAPRIVRTNAFGNFQFSDIEAGQFYVITVQHKRYGFAQNSQAFSLTGNLTNLVFRADWQN